MIRSVGWPQGGCPAPGVKSTAFGAGRQAGQFQSSAGGLATAPLIWMEGKDRVFGRQKQAERRQSGLLYSCDSKECQPKSMFGAQPGGQSLDGVDGTSVSTSTSVGNPPSFRTHCWLPVNSTDDTNREHASCLLQAPLWGLPMTYPSLTAGPRVTDGGTIVGGLTSR